MKRAQHRKFPSHRTAGITLLVCALTLAASITPRAAMADTPQQQRAVALSGRAKAAYKSNEFQQAAMLYQQAYAQVPEPTLLFNAARAYQKGKFLREALSMFRLYLTLATHDDDETRAGRAEAVANIAAIDKELQHAAELRAQKDRAAAEARAHGAQPDPTTAEPTTAGPTTAGPTTAGPTTAGPTTAGPPPSGTGTPPTTGGPPPAMPAPTVIAPPEIAKPPSAQKPVHRPGLFSRVSSQGWTDREIGAVALMGGGAAIVLTGIVLHVAASSALSDLDADLARGRIQQGGTTYYGGITQTEAQKAIDTVDGRRLGGNLLLGVGAAAIGVGTWLWLSRRLDGENKLSLAPTIGKDGVGWTLQGRF